MGKLVSVLLVVLFVNFCFGTTVYLRKGGTIEGEVISKDDEKFVLKTADGEKTLKWRSVKNKSIQEIYPELYEALKKQAIERKNKKEEKFAKKNEEEKEKKIDFSRIRLEVNSNESEGAFKKTNASRSSRNYKKESKGKLDIELSNLDPEKTYTLKTIYSHYIKEYKKSKPPKKEDSDITKKETLSGNNKYHFCYFSSPYYMYKFSLKSGVSFTGGNKKRHKYGDKGDGWDVSIWLNDTLIYEDIKGKNPVFHNRISH